VGEPDGEQIAEALEREADAMEHDSRELQNEVDEARADWRRKRADGSVPGAPPPAEDEDEDAPQAGN
jgi:hypothetical protein